jgi:IclR family KDG regulon transcriptional repressor
MQAGSRELRRSSGSSGEILKEQLPMTKRSAKEGTISRNPKTAKKPEGKAISATLRTVAILEALAECGNSSLESLAVRVSLAKPTLFRFLKTLKTLGYVLQHEDMKYSLSLKMFNVGAKALQSMDLSTIAQPIIRNLSDHFGETVHVAVKMEDMVVYIMKVESRHTIRMYSTIGRRAHMHCTSLGKALLSWDPDSETLARRIPLVRFTQNTITDIDALLSEMEATRARGYSIDAEEHESNIHCIGAPVFDLSGTVVAAISVAWPIFRFDPAREGEWALEVMAAAKRISTLLGHEQKVQKNQ